MTPEHWTQLISAIGSIGSLAGALAIYIKAQATERKIDANTEETKGARLAAENGTALKEKLIQENTALRLEVDRLHRIEAGMDLLAEGQAFKVALDRVYGARRILYKPERTAP